MRRLGLLLLFLAMASAGFAHGDMKNQIQRCMSFGVIRIVKHILSDDGLILEMHGRANSLSKAAATDSLAIFFQEYPARYCKIDFHDTYKDGTRHFTGVYVSENGSEMQAYFEAKASEEGHYELTYVRLEE